MSGYHVRMLIDDIKSQVIAAMKAKDATRRDVLKVALGDVQMGETRKGSPLTDEEAAALVKKIVKGNEETLQANVDDAAREKLTFEIQVLTALLPQTLDVPQIIQALAEATDAIAAAGNDGMATGIAMKHLKGSGAAVEGKDVSAAVKQMRS